MAVEDFNPHLGNIFSVFCKADRLDIKWGMTAYENYRKKISEIAFGTRYGPMIACGVFSALSPNIDEAANFTGLVRLLGHHDGPIPGYPENIKKARRIMSGEDPAVVLKGLKTNAFYSNLVAPTSDHHPVVVDAHMYSVWSMKRYKVTGINIAPKIYNQVSDDFKRVASRLGIRPNQLQAICWSTWKRVNGIVFDSQLKMEF